jgi:putative mRNA 3-end processing factor
MQVSALLESTDYGLYCADGDFYIDPWGPVERAVVTHAHSDHARPGSNTYLTTSEGTELLRLRIGEEATITPLEYGETLLMGSTRVSLHPAGHILGSAQVRLERNGEVWVVSGDYKLGADCTTTKFELVQCNTFITESTFGLPIYRWQDESTIFNEINEWWSMNRDRGWTSILYSYALGKSQRILAGVDTSIGPIAAHGAVLRFLPSYKAAGIKLPNVIAATADTLPQYKGAGLVIAPPSASGSTWPRKFGLSSDGLASGWMQIRGTRRRRAIDRGFVLSDHADWDGLLSVIASTGAENVGVTHGYTDTMVRYLQERGFHSWEVPTLYVGDEDAANDDIQSAELETTSTS